MPILYIASSASISPLFRTNLAGFLMVGNPVFLWVKRDVCVALILPDRFYQIINLLTHTFKAMYGCAYMVGVWRVGIHS